MIVRSRGWDGSECGGVVVRIHRIGGGDPETATAQGKNETTNDLSDFRGPQPRPEEKSVT